MRSIFIYLQQFIIMKDILIARFIILVFVQKNIRSIQYSNLVQKTLNYQIVHHITWI